LKLTKLKTPRKTSNPQTWQAVCVCVFLALAVLAVFGQTVHFEFVNFDDQIYVYENPQLAGGLSLGSVAWAFTHAECSLYHPLTMLSLRLDYQLHGLHAGGYHLTNVLIHTASVILLFLLLRRMTGALWRSAFVAAVFAIHPLRVESVAWVTERKDVLGTFFFMLTVGAYVRYAQYPNSLGRYLQVVVFYVLGLLSKPMAVTLPFVLLLLDYWPLQRFRAGTPTRAAPLPAQPPGSARRLILEKIPLLALAALASVVTYCVVNKAVTGSAPIPMPVRMENACISYVVYLRQMVWPTGLAAFYPFPQKGPPFWEIASAFLLLAVISGGVLAFWRKRPWLPVGWFWYLGMLVPVIGIVDAGEFAHADRNTCLPQIGLYVLLAWAVAERSAGWRHGRLLQGGMSTAILVVLMFCAHAQTSYWQDSESLWTRAVDCTSGNYLARKSLGDDLDKHGRLDEAVVQYRRALEIRPGYADAHNNLGVSLEKFGKPDEAIAQYRAALAIQPGRADARFNLGRVLLNQGKLDEAAAQYRIGLGIKPDNAEANNNLGNALLRLGKPEEAIIQYRRALEIAPDYAEALNNLGNALTLKGADEAAIVQFQKSLEIRPGLAAAHYSLGNTFLKLGKLDEAITQYRKLLAITPANAEALNNLGTALDGKGEDAAATAQFQKALEIQPGYADARFNLGRLLLKQGKLDEAVAQFRKAVEINPGDAEARNNLGKTLLLQGDFDGAMACFEKTTAMPPDLLARWYNLGNGFLQKEDWEAAIACYRQAIKINPRSVEACANLGMALLQKGETREAIDSWQQALAINPDQITVLNNLAWLLATTPDALLRNGAKAVALAARASQLSGDSNPEILHTLGAAYAEDGKYAQAAATARHALELAVAQKKDALAVALQKEIKLYEASTPLRSGPR
jgi:tetratricopeptide (TPR) repeat protein